MNIFHILLKSLTFKGGVSIFANSLQALAHSLFVGLSLQFIFDNPNDNIIVLLMLAFGLFVYFVLLIPVFGYLMENDQFRFRSKLQAALYNRIFATRFKQRYEEHTAKLQNEIAIDIPEAASVIGWATIALVQAVIAGVTSAVIMGIYSLQIALLLLGIGILSLSVSGFLSRKVSRLTVSLRTLEDERMMNTMETLDNFVALKISGFTKVRATRGSVLNSQIYNLNRKLNILTNLNTFISETFLSGAFNAVVIVFGAAGIVRGDITFGTFLLILSMVSGMEFLFGSISGYIVDFRRRLVSLRKIEMRLGGGESKDGAGAIHLKTLETIEFRNVSFGYDADNKLIDSLSFKVCLPCNLLLTGANGTGKSTVFKLLAGILKPDEGKILLNGIDIIEYNSSSVASKIAYVPQIPRFFTGSLEENISLGRVELTSDEVLEILKIVKLQNFEANIEENATNMSQGEKSRLAIARALVTRPALIMLDEVDAHLDQHTLTTMYNNIKDLGVSTLQIAHTIQIESHTEVISMSR